MEIIVCIKQVPDTTDIKIDPVTNTLIRSGVPSIINPFDMYAIEEGLRIKEKIGGKVTVVSMGPPQVESAFKEAIALGVDECILFSDKKFAGSDTLATSYVLSQGINKIEDWDLIICGKQAADGDTAQVGPGIAELLHIPQSTYVKKIESIDEPNKKMTVQRMTDIGTETIELNLPALITVVKEINDPRMPSLRGKMRAKKYNHQTLTADDLNVENERLGLDGSPTKVVRIFTPELKGGGELYEGETKEIAEKVFNRLKELKIIN
ncbi:electron transfer flavoprotein subunit beta/FixA family protein [Candidatus Dependentiae bacterium]|nr:electron transfer flavoprotein subunit beta/FixA family protein [Candidatus Dependentiae bacterium]